MELCERILPCEWKDDCRQCANFTANRECVSRDFCEWDQGTLPTYPIKPADIVFVVGELVCELWTSLELFKHIKGQGMHDNNMWRGTIVSGRRKTLVGFTLICFIADISFTVGKLFPTTYACRNLDCAKITHNCVLTIVSFFLIGL